MTHPIPPRVAADALRARNLREAQDGITGVRILHLQDERARCGHCGVPWPCPTWEATETDWERTRRHLEGQMQTTRQQSAQLVQEFGAADRERVSCLKLSIDAAGRGHGIVAALVGLHASTGVVASLLGMDEDTVRWHLAEADSGGLLGQARKGVAR